jgi:hypothetical protein
LADLNAEVDINSAWETNRENIKMSAKESLGYCELKKHKPWFDEGCSELVDQRKQAKLQWLQDPSEINGDNLKIVRREANRYFRNKKTQYMQDRIKELATNGKNKIKIKSVDEIIGDHQCGLRRNRSTAKQLFCINQKWEYSERVRQLFIDFKSAYDSVRREVLYNILINNISKYLSDSFRIQNGLKQGEALSPLIFNFNLECIIRKVQENQVELKLNGTHHHLAYADDVNLLGDNIDTKKKTPKL